MPDPGAARRVERRDRVGQEVLGDVRVVGHEVDARPEHAIEIAFAALSSAAWPCLDGSRCARPGPAGR